MIALFIKGGPIMWPLLIVSVVALAVALERIIRISGTCRGLCLSTRSQFLHLAREHRDEDAIALGKSSSDPVVRVLAAGLQHGPDSYEEAITFAADGELELFEKGLPILDTTITLAPLLGLLGTVTGMISAFGLLGASELDAPAAITGGIAEALIATAYGLGIAITALLPYNYVIGTKERLEREIERSATELQLVLQKRRPETVKLAKVRAA